MLVLGKKKLDIIQALKKYDELSLASLPKSLIHHYLN